MHSVTSMEEFLEIVLAYTFPSTIPKQKIDPTSKGYRIACPICGDSETKISSKRGNIYTNTNTYKCFNGGCRAFMSLGTFVAQFALKYDIDISEMDINMKSEYKTDGFNVKNVGSNAIRDYLFDVGAINQMPDIAYFAKRLGLTQIKYASPQSEVYKYASSRQLFDTEHNVEAFFKDAFDSKLYMMNYDYETKKVISMSTRDIYKKSFMIYTMSDLLKKMNYDPDFVTDIETIDQLSNIFNIFNVDFREKIRITEGPIDGAFLFNYLAIQGITKTSMLFDFVDPKNTYIIFDNDEEGRKSAARALEDGMNVLMWSNLIHALRKFYYKQVIKVNKCKDVNDIYKLIKSNNSIDMVTFNKFIDKFFGNHPLDLFNI